MEIEGLGARCALQSCRHLDFLPITCPSCSRTFCNDHHLSASHRCTEPVRSVPTCPACSQPVPVPAGSTPDAAVSRHISLGCPKPVRTNPPCAFGDCRVRDAVATTCPACRRAFCLAHRHEADHACAAQRPAQPGVNPFGIPLARAPGRAAAARASSARKSPSRFFRKAQPTPAPAPQRTSSAGAQGSTTIRTDFSNTPATPVGDPKVEVEDRVHVALFFPRKAGLPPRYVYFSRRHSAGRVVDILTRDVKAIPAPAEGIRYGLYAVKRGVSGVNLLPYITPLKDLPPDVLQNGDVVVMEEGEAGLDEVWLTALRKGKSGRRLASSRKSGGVSQRDKCTVT